MMFRTVKTALVNLLNDQSLGLFRVIGHDTQSKSAEGMKGIDQLVQVVYDQGQFPKGSSGQYGPVSHDISFDVVLSVSATAKGDLSVLENPGSSDIQKAAAIASIKTASAEADDKIDNFIEEVFQILMDARNVDAGLDSGSIANRFVDSIIKHDALENGNLVVKTAVIKYTCRVSEDIRGETGIYPDTVTTSTDFGEGHGIDAVNDNIVEE